MVQGQGRGSSSISLGHPEAVIRSSHSSSCIPLPPLHPASTCMTRFSGKTFSAEATSEHVRRLLYVIGGGDLGTRAADLDASLERMFDIATAYATTDVVLERRSLHDLERNAMVSVFLSHVEYYRDPLPDAEPRAGLRRGVPLAHTSRCTSASSPRRRARRCGARSLRGPPPPLRVECPSTRCRSRCSR
ncbi:hypothetical protein B0H14DRAFT_2902907 [Mycena olivaceomarginata]|nr:hypothetical protein B0H14DRAFT_2902907 [Mycena olivaceomarginata]